MRKLFRMKYESCSGECYAYSDVMRIHTLGLDATGAAAFLRRLIAAHGPSCGDPGIEFRLDHDEATGVFIASMQRHGALDLHAGRTPLEALDKMIDGALLYYGTAEFRDRRRADHALGVVFPDRAAVCHHGTDAKLVDFAIEFSGLDAEGRAALRAEFA